MSELQEIVKNKLKEIYDGTVEKVVSIIEVFNEQFGEENVDNNLPTFDRFLETLTSVTIKDLGIKKFSDENNYGKYSIDIDDYRQNYAKQSIFDYMPDIGILDYSRDLLSRMIRDMSFNDVYIIIHFPEVKVTNENDKYIIIRDLYVKVPVYYTGRMCGSFDMLKASYDYIQAVSAYSHSHLPKVFSKERMTSWCYPCLGSGPIKYTMNSLINQYDCDLNLWGLFAYELSKYVTIESLAGGPYIKLETVGAGTVFYEYNNYSTTNIYKGTAVLDKFIAYYAQLQRFKIKYINNCYKMGVSFTQFCIDISNEFIKWYNTICKDIIDINSMFRKCYIDNGRIMEISKPQGLDDAKLNEINGTVLLNFKGEDVHLNIDFSSKLNTYEANSLLILKAGYCNTIAVEIMDIINYKYGKRKISKRQPKTVFDKKPVFI